MRLTSLFLCSTLFISSLFSQTSDRLLVGENENLSSFTLQDATGGGSLNLGDAMGEEGLVLIFSSNTCSDIVGSGTVEGYSIQYNMLQHLSATLGMSAVLVNSNELNRSTTESFLSMETLSQTEGYSLPYLLDSAGAIAELLGAETTPDVFVFSVDWDLLYSGKFSNSPDNDIVKVIYPVRVAEQYKKESPLHTPTTPVGCFLQ